MSERITTIAHEGLTFDVLDEGPVEGAPVVLLHGFPERSSSWREVAPLLHAAGLRTLAMDQRGYSPGARPRGRRSYRMQHLAGDVAALIGRLGQPVHLVGHDWGAAVGWAVAGRFPSQVLTYTALSVPHPAAFARAMRGRSQRRRSRYMALFNLPVLPELAARRPGGYFDRAMARGGMTPDEVARFRREVVEYGALRHALGWYRALPLTRPGGTDFRVAVPTTLVWSDRDIAIGREGVDGTARWVDAPYDLVVLAGVGHWIPTQAPRAAADAILARVRG
ncbi:alpha/beta fold hydrolase [Nocardioides hungaricus]